VLTAATFSAEIKVMAPMKIRIRIREDWLELILALLLGYVAARAGLAGDWLVALLAVGMLAGTGYLWWRQAKARWCTHCQAPMKRTLVPKQDWEKICYVCDSCGRVHDSGVEWGRPE